MRHSTLLSLLVLTACQRPGIDRRPGDDSDPPLGPDPELREVEDPGQPEYPDVVSVVSAVVETAPGTFSGTNANDLDLCLTQDDCYPLDVATVDDFRPGEIDVYHFEGLALARADIDRVEIRSADGDDRWTLGCLQVQLDGQPAYCRDGLELEFGVESDELQRWTDAPDTLDCTTCFDDTLTHGPMLGAVGSDTARVWVRTDSTRPVALRMGTALADAPLVAWAYPSPERDFTAVLEVSGLVADKTYRYQVEVDGEPRDAHELTTAPEPGTQGQWSFVFGSCSKDALQPIFAQIDSLQPDLFLFVGDNHYGNTDVVDALRWNYRWSLERPQRAALLTHTPTYATWDDHDFVGNNTFGSEPGRDDALRVFREYWANPSYGTPDVPGVFFATSYGDVDLFFLDDRYYRGLDDSILGDAQTDWALDAIAASDATFKLLIDGSQWSTGGSSDSWAAFPEARTAFFTELFARGVEGVVVMAGDIHRSEMRLLSPVGAPGEYRVPELISSPLATWNSLCPSSSELVACYDDGTSFLHVAIDTSAADPVLTATLHDRLGTPLSTWDIHRSELSLE